jgi:hypothetical protein
MRRPAIAPLALLAALAVLVVPQSPAAPKPTTVTITVVKGRPVGGIKRPTVNKGTVVRFVVRADRGESVHLHGYDVDKPVRPGKPTVIQLVTRIPGRFELELHEPDSLLARLTVKP